jgi:hypothetical protein
VNAQLRLHRIRIVGRIKPMSFLVIYYLLLIILIKTGVTAGHRIPMLGAWPPNSGSKCLFAQVLQRTVGKMAATIGIHTRDINPDFRASRAATE